MIPVLDDVGPTKRRARLAGLLYLLSGIPGVFSYQYMPGALVVPTDAAATAQRIANASLTFRLAIAADVVNSIGLLLLGLTLYNLLGYADRRHARAMLVFAAVGAIVAIANVFNLLAPLWLLADPARLPAFSKAQTESLALAFLHWRNSGLNVAQIFWGVWLFPFGVLVIKSGVIPKVFGYLLIPACFAYVAASFAEIVLPAPPHLFYMLMQGVGGIAEGGISLWLLIAGVRVPGGTDAAVASSGTERR